MTIKIAKDIVLGMSLWEIIVIAISLSMDALAVAICKGLSVEKITMKEATLVGLYFGIAQAVMPIIGYFLASAFSSYIKAIDHWIAFVLLTLIGLNMIVESLRKDDKEESCINQFSFKALFPLAIATSIDALAIGVTFAFFSVNIALSSSLIGIITFTLSLLGAKLGAKLGEKFKKNAERLGGSVLIFMGIKILITHLLEG